MLQVRAIVENFTSFYLYLSTDCDQLFAWQSSHDYAHWLTYNWLKLLKLRSFFLTVAGSVHKTKIDLIMDLYFFLIFDRPSNSVRYLLQTT